MLASCLLSKRLTPENLVRILKVCDRPRLLSLRGAARLTSKRHYAGDSLRRSGGTHPPLRTGADPFSGALEALEYSGLRLNANPLRVQIERALGGAHLGGGEAQVLGRSSEVAMTKQ